MPSRASQPHRPSGSVVRGGQHPPRPQMPPLGPFANCAHQSSQISSIRSSCPTPSGSDYQLGAPRKEQS